MRAKRPTGNRTQRYNWQRLSSVLSSDLLLAAIELDGAGQVGIRSVPWDEYWHSAQLPAFTSMRPSLDALRWAWAGYIRSGFQLRLAAPYCYAYFSLLRRSLGFANEGRTSMRFLQAILGFECVAVHWREKPTPLVIMPRLIWRK